MLEKVKWFCHSPSRRRSSFPQLLQTTPPTILGLWRWSTPSWRSLGFHVRRAVSLHRISFPRWKLPQSGVRADPHASGIVHKNNKSWIIILTAPQKYRFRMMSTTTSTRSQNQTLSSWETWTFLVSVRTQNLNNDTHSIHPSRRLQVNKIIICVLCQKRDTRNRGLARDAALRCRCRTCFLMYHQYKVGDSPGFSSAS